MTYNIIRALRAMGMTEKSIYNATTNYQGYSFNVTNGLNSQNLQVPGTAVALLGIVVNVTQGANDDYFSLKLNNETIIETMATYDASRSSNMITSNGFIPCFRRMNGKDTLVMSYNNTTGGDSVQATLIYLTQYTSALRGYSSAPIKSIGR